MKKTIILYLTLPIVLGISFIAQIKRAYAITGIQSLYGVVQPTPQNIFLNILWFILVPIAVVVLIILGIIKLVKRKSKNKQVSQVTNEKSTSNDKQDFPDR